MTRSLLLLIALVVALATLATTATASTQVPGPRAWIETAGTETELPFSGGCRRMVDDAGVVDGVLCGDPAPGAGPTVRIASPGTSVLRFSAPVDSVHVWVDGTDGVTTERIDALRWSVTFPTAVPADAPFSIQARDTPDEALYVGRFAALVPPPVSDPGPAPTPPSPASPRPAVPGAGFGVLRSWTDGRTVFARISVPRAATITMSVRAQGARQGKLVRRALPPGAHTLRVVLPKRTLRATLATGRLAVRYGRHGREIASVRLPVPR